MRISQRFFAASALFSIGALACAGLTKAVDNLTAPTAPGAQSSGEQIGHIAAAGTPWDAYIGPVLGSGGLLAAILGSAKGNKEHKENEVKIAQLQAKVDAKGA